MCVDPGLVHAMNAPDFLAQLRTDWRHVGHGLASRCAATHVGNAHPDLGLDDSDDLFDVVQLLEPRSGRPVLWRAAVVSALLEEARDPLVRRALLQTLLPGTVSVCRQLRFGDGIVDDPRDFFATAVSYLDELLCDWAGQSRAYAAGDLLSALRGRVRRWMLKEKEARATAVIDSNVDLVAPDSSPLLTRLATLAQGPHQRLARLTYARVFEGCSLDELAARDRTSPESLRQQLRQFAQHHLL